MSSPLLWLSATLYCSIGSSLATLDMVASSKGRGWWTTTSRHLAYTMLWPFYLARDLRSRS